MLGGSAVEHPMRIAILILSSGVAIFFAVSLLLTFLAKDYINGLAEEFVIVLTQKYADPAVEVAEEALRSPGSKKLLGEAGHETAQEEIAEYRGDPRGYITRLVAMEPLPAPAVVPGVRAALKAHVLRWKLAVQEYFHRTLSRLIGDLRIFSGSNLVAALVAFGCALRAKDRQVNWLLGVSGLLLASVAYGAYMYVDSFTYFRILFSTYLGWWYPAILAITFLGLYLEYGRHFSQTAEQAD
jgi:hypothetical protein